MSLLTVKNLSKIYKNNRGIKNLDLIIEPGEIVALLGPNGAGKTTAIKSMLGFVNITDGLVIMQNYTMNEIEKARKETGIMVGKPMPYDFLTGYKHMKIHSRLYDQVDDHLIDQALEAVLLTPYKHERIKHYSTGMKQRLAFAQAIVHKPKLLILDEPFSGLDIEGKAAIKNRIKQLCHDEQVGVLISSHLIHDIEDMATKVCIIHDNRWLVTESVNHILRTYSSLEAYYLDQVQKKVVYA
ncbi:ABC transporter ATP-binding protein [Vallitalea pronyensis]|uniref:ABC transporter ATP-binding protein n=1 Tax=Vallitalea pronyensis TaxID=1348613 RepID=A0A8J8MGA9_9FIRM|nr:ABC transporter ATP-binding protein [Vallitalea pronyensis]QUI20977.1 ABC transporter ATP-binding protein [Vallitalea pronyensis]